jgi:hypothetical protein
MSYIYPIGHLLLGMTELLLIGWSIRLWQSSKVLAMVMLPLFLLSTSYDNLVLAFGGWLGEGELLHALTQLRFLLHYLVVPFLLIVGIEFAHRIGIFSIVPSTRKFSWTLTIGLGLIDYFNSYLNLSLVPTEFLGVLRYTQEQPAHPPIVAIGVNLFLIVLSIAIWVRSKGKGVCLFWGSLICLLGNAMPLSQVGTLVGSASELVLGMTLLLTEQYLQSDESIQEVMIRPQN